jgi:FtsZ-binding cell division protein ZapB
MLFGVNLFNNKIITTMLQTFEGTIDNGQIIWNDPDNAPRNAKVLVTVLQLEKEPTKIEKPSLRFRGALKNLSKEQKEKNNQDLQNLRNEWQRDI